MKRILLIFVICNLFVSCSLYLGISAPAEAQPLYTTIYWVMGEVADPDNVGREGRRVVLYKDDPVNGFADDLVGAVGLAGAANSFRLSAFEDPRMLLVTGKYKVAIVTGADGYGADPVEFDITGYGFETVPVKLVMTKGGGIPDPGVQPSYYLPSFEYIKFGNRRYQKALVARGKEFIVSSSPRISAKVISPVGLDLASVAMVLNEGTGKAKTYKVKSANIVSAAGPQTAPTEIAFVYDFIKENQESLPAGEQALTFKAANAYGEAVEATTVTVAGGEPRLIGVPITYPSPVRLMTDKQVTFQYTLSHDISIDLRVLDVSGRVVKQFLLNAREEGGSAGVNKVNWDLKTQQGNIIASGIYVFSIINRDTKKLLGRGKLTALGQ